MSFTIEFSPWGRFRARKKDEAIRSWLQGIGDASKEKFRTGASRQWGGGPGAPPGAWPMRRSGRLLGTIDTVVTNDSVTIGSNGTRGNFSYSAWLKNTGRKMSKEALEEGMRSAGRLSHWVEWSRF